MFTMEVWRTESMFLVISLCILSHSSLAVGECNAKKELNDLKDSVRKEISLINDVILKLYENICLLQQRLDSLESSLVDNVTEGAINNKAPSTKSTISLGHDCDKNNTTVREPFNVLPTMEKTTRHENTTPSKLTPGMDKPTTSIENATPSNGSVSPNKDTTTPSNEITMAVMVSANYNMNETTAIRQPTTPVTEVSPNVNDITTTASYRNTCRAVPKSGVYDIYFDSLGRHVTVYCDQDTDGGGWLVFMRRKDGTENFTRSWKDYKTGFGNQDKEFWAGNEMLHDLTNPKPVELRIDMKTQFALSFFAKYEQFQIGPEEDKYRLHVSGFSGSRDLHDTMAEPLRKPKYYRLRHNGQQFSTYDNDNDLWEDNCADLFKGGWWYTRCVNSLFTGTYSANRDDNRVVWSQDYSFINLGFVEMKIRQV